MATWLSGTSRNVPSILGFEMLFREDYKSLNIISNPAIGTFRDVPSFKSHHPYNVTHVKFILWLWLTMSLMGTSCLFLEFWLRGLGGGSITGFFHVLMLVGDGGLPDSPSLDWENVGEWVSERRAEPVWEWV